MLCFFPKQVIQRQSQCFTDTDTIPVEVEETTEAPVVTTAPDTTQTPETTEEPEVTTAPDTTEEPEVTTAPETTETPVDTTKPEDTTGSNKDKGCGSVVSAGIAIIAILGSAIILKKRD